MGRPAHIHGGIGVAAMTENGHALIAYGTTLPTDGKPGFATGCLFLKLDGTAGTALYCNEGTSAACDFDAVSVA